MPPQALATIAGAAGRDADILVCEGLMGLFDGAPGDPGRTGSTADVAALLDAPVLLALDVSGQSQSAGAIAKGCLTYDPRLRFAGAVLNKVGGERHARLSREAVEAVGLTVFGALPRRADLSLPERHLGLVQAGETRDLHRRLDELADFVEANLDLDAIFAAARGGGDSFAVGAKPIFPLPGRRIAIAWDEVFSFIYEHALDAWRAAGADLVFFSPLADQPPPENCDFCWLPGGYPELRAGKLAAAGAFMTGLRQFARSKPVHGECGGYMVLGERLVDAAGQSHEMAGLLDHSTSFAQRKLTLGYREAVLIADGPLGQAGARLRGHEFHYATLAERGLDAPFAMVHDAYGSQPQPTGARRGGVSGSFFHAVAFCGE